MNDTRYQNGGLSYSEGPEYIPPVESFKDIFTGVLNQYGDRPALVSAQQRDDSLFTVAERQRHSGEDCIRYTFRDLHHHAKQLASALYAQGLRPRQSLATFLPNSAEFAICLLAAAILNVSLVPLDPRSLGRIDEVRHYLSVVRPDATIVSDEQCAISFDSIDSAGPCKSSLKILIDGVPATKGGWLRLRDMMNQTPPLTTLEPALETEILETDTALIIFTSGTSGLPKACALSSRNIASFIRIPQAARRMGLGKRYLQHFPISHIGAISTMLGAWAAGACLVIPSPYFDAQASLDAIERDSCTAMLAVPAVVDQLLALPTFAPGRVRSLEVVVVSATMASPEFLAKCKDPAGFGARNVLHAYGMTEALGLLGWDDDDEQIVEQGFASVGKPNRGVKIKICPPGKRECSAMGESGELHVSTPALTPGYLGGGQKDFYEESGSWWFASGDQARMHASGAVFILGRYKDVIVRGGENLSPALVEHCINGRFPAIQVQVVGVTDEPAGEVPVAIVCAPSGLRPDVVQIQKLVRERLGMAAVPERILTLEDLGLTAFPSTLSGKIEKYKLKKSVKLYLDTTRQKHDLGNTLQPSDPLNSRVKAAMLEELGDLLGHESQDPSLKNQPLSRTLDSLSMMKFASVLRTKHGIDVSMAEMILCSSLDDLASRKTQSSGRKRINPAALSKDGPPDHEELVFEEKSGCTRSRLELVLQSLGLSWSKDVEEVYPIAGTAVWIAMKETPFYHKWTMATPSSSYDQVRHAVETSLLQWPVLRTVAAEYSEDLRLLVALKAQKSYFDLAISELPEVESTKSLGDALSPPHHSRGSLAEGILFRVGVARMKDTGTLSLVIVANHAVYDALSIQAWAEDLQRILNGHEAVNRIPFKLFADAYYLYQDSPLAKRNTDHQKQLLQQNGLTLDALWPAGHELVTSRPSAAGSSAGQSKALGEDAGRDFSSPLKHGAGIMARTVHCPNMTKLRSSQALSPVILAKMTIILLNSHLTKQPYAILTVLMAGRTWPFISPDLEQHLPNAFDIAGPTMTSVTDVSSIEPQEEIRQLYRRLEAEQQRLNAAQHVPRSMMSHLDAASQDLRMQARRQIFNWIPGHHGKERNALSGGLQAVGRPGEGNDAPAGVAWMCGLADSETLSFRLRWNLMVLEERDVVRILDLVGWIVGWTCEPGNWSRRVEVLMMELQCMF